MLITPLELSRYWRLRPQRILHVGAHAAEEAVLYERQGWGTAITVWIEADEGSIMLDEAALEGKPNALVVQALAWDETGTRIPFHVASNGQSSSALSPADHVDFYPDITFAESKLMTTMALADDLTIQDLAPYHFINLDIQGAELRALKGLRDLLRSTVAVYSEVNTRELYAGCAMLGDLDAYLSSMGFVRVDTQMTSDDWGDALWIRADSVPRLPKIRRAARLADKLVRRLARAANRRLHRSAG